MFNDFRTKMFPRKNQKLNGKTTHSHTHISIGKLQISYETYLAPHMFMCVYVDCAF